ncbi:MAG: aldehyde ferredoxin oxidoreductase N-terminal domain-containing protein, partial [Thermodesulfobacteriota bacterium]
MYGNHGKILQVDLSTGNVRQREFDENFTRKFMGGNGFMANLIYDHVPPDADPAGGDRRASASSSERTPTNTSIPSRG